MKILLITYPNENLKFEALLTTLLEKKLIACANVVNWAQSYFSREWKITKEEEKIILMKFPTEKEEELIALIKQFHPYQIPELIVLHPESIDADYLKRGREVTSQ